MEKISLTDNGSSNDHQLIFDQSKIREISYDKIYENIINEFEEYDYFMQIHKKISENLLKYNKIIRVNNNSHTIEINFDNKNAMLFSIIRTPWPSSIEYRLERIYISYNALLHGILDITNEYILYEIEDKSATLNWWDPKPKACITKNYNRYFGSKTMIRERQELFLKRFKLSNCHKWSDEEWLLWEMQY